MHSSFQIHRATNKIIPVDKRLRLYNQYPGCYANFKAMTKDLERIKAMGFKQVWINPFYATCASNFINPAKVKCPYAMRDHTQINPEYGESFREVQKYTRRANELGLIPFFDLVARHVSIDSVLPNGDRALKKKGIDTTRWFKRHPNGNYVINGMDENFKSISADPWSDVVEFNYDDPEICKEIIEYFWKPFIDYNIMTLGFMGARLDAVGRIPRHIHESLLPYINKVSRKTHGRDAYLIAETVGVAFLHKDMVVKGLVTHTMNSAFWMPGPEGRDGYSYSLWQDDNNLYAKAKKTLQTAGPSAGHSGSHDEERYPQILAAKGITDPEILRQRMLEMIMVSAFNSDGGHIMVYGDEFGIRERINLLKRKIIDLETEKQYDLTKEITEVNAIISRLPDPTSPEWTQRVFCNKHPELVIFIVHQGEGYSGKCHVIIGNTGKVGTMVNQEMINEILKANGRNKAPGRIHPQQIFLCGELLPNPDLVPEVIHERDQCSHKYRKRFG